MKKKSLKQLYKEYREADDDIKYEAKKAREAKNTMDHLRKPQIKFMPQNIVEISELLAYDEAKYIVDNYHNGIANKALHAYADARDAFIKENQNIESAIIALSHSVEINEEKITQYNNNKKTDFYDAGQHLDDAASKCLKTSIEMAKAEINLEMAKNAYDRKNHIRRNCVIDY